MEFINKTNPFYQNEFQKDVWAAAIGGVYRSMGNIDSGNIQPSRLYILLKEYDKAITALNQLIKRDRERNNFIALGGDLTILSKAYLGKNENVAALNAAREGLSSIKTSKRYVLLIKQHETLSDIFHKLGNSANKGKFGCSFRNTLFGNTALTTIVSNPIDTLHESFSSKVLTDISINYTPKSWLTITAGANNIFDVYPDRIKNCRLTGQRITLYSNGATPFGANGGYYYVSMSFNF